jgi:hypothetical protein
MEDGTSSTQNTVPFPTLTILYLPIEPETIVAEIGQKYNNMTAEDCTGYFAGGAERQFKKVTIWSQGIDSLGFNAIVARIKELSDLTKSPIVSGGIMYCI